MALCYLFLFKISAMHSGMAMPGVFPTDRYPGAVCGTL